MEDDKKKSLFGWLATLLALFLVGAGIALFFQQDSGQKVVEIKKQAVVVAQPDPKPPAVTTTNNRMEQDSLRLTLAETIRKPKPPLRRSVQPESLVARSATTAQIPIAKPTETVAPQPTKTPELQPTETVAPQPTKTPELQPTKRPTQSDSPPIQTAEQPVTLDRPSVSTDILYEEPSPETEKKLPDTHPDTPPTLPEGKKVRTLNTLALIIDDLGYNASISNAMVSLPFDITLAILPGVPHAREIAKLGQQAGREILLHQPMEPRQYPHINPGPGVILSSMDKTQIQAVLRANLELFPEVVGVNNHMGSRLTEQTDAMDAVMSVLAERHLFFIDSRTSNSSVAHRRAAADGVPTAARHIFIDNVPKESAILHQLTQMERMAQKQGDVIGIGHPYRETLAALQHWLPTLSKKGIRLVRVSRLLHPLSARAHYPDRDPALQKANAQTSPAPLHAADRNLSHDTH